MSPDQIAAGGSESSQQKALFAWAAMARLRGFRDAFNPAMYVRDTSRGPVNVGYVAIPELEWLHSVPNGGKRDVKTAARMKAEGARRGIPDIFWPYAAGNWHGLYIEMKVNDNVLSEDQKSFRTYAARAGYLHVVAYTWREAALAIARYYGFAC